MALAFEMIPTKDDTARAPVVPAKPPAPRAPAVLDHLRASKQALAALEAEIAERALASSERRAGGKEGLAALHQKIAAAKFEIDSNALAHELALQLDKQSVVAWKAAVQAMPPRMIVDGISLTKCCQLCSPEFGCVITKFGPCGHPKLVGALNPKHQGDPAVRGPFVAACRQLEKQVEEDDDE